MRVHKVGQVGFPLLARTMVAQAVAAQAVSGAVSQQIEAEMGVLDFFGHTPVYIMPGAEPEALFKIIPILLVQTVEDSLQHLLH